MRHKGLVSVALVAALVFPACKSKTKSKRRSDLAALPYLSHAEIPKGEEEKSGVTKHAPERAAPGFNLYSSRASNRALLVDMAGKTVHSWQSAEIDEIGPPGPPGSARWLGKVELDPEGNLYILARGKVLAKLRNDSSLEWMQLGYFHHDLEIGVSGKVLTIHGVLRNVPVPGTKEQVPILDDLLTIVSKDGLHGNISVYDLLGHRIPAERLQQLSTMKKELGGERGNDDEFVVAALESRVPDVFHTNSVRSIDRDVPGLCGRGALLFSVRELDTIAVVDIKTGKLVWEYGPGELQEQHDASLLANGDILVFDNGVRREASRVVQIRPSTGKIVWQYEGDPPGSFYSKRKGSAQRLANGNTLIAESDRGRAFEITPDGTIVWEFFNPDVTTQDGKLVRGEIYRMERIPEEVVRHWLQRN